MQIERSRMKLNYLVSTIHVLVQARSIDSNLMKFEARGVVS